MLRVAISTGLLFVVLGCDSPDLPEAADPGDAADTAGRMLVEKALQGILKAPSTAKYPQDSIRATELGALEGHRAWLVTGAVDSQNSFSAMVRGQWETVIVLKDGDWFPVYIGLDGETVFGEKRYRSSRSNSPIARAHDDLPSRPPAAATIPEIVQNAVKPADEEVNRERKAASALELGKRLYYNGRESAAKPFFQSVVDEYPETQAADEARQRLGIGR
jgi:hypothetical protein